MRVAHAVVEIILIYRNLACSVRQKQWFIGGLGSKLCRGNQHQGRRSLFRAFKIAKLNGISAGTTAHALERSYTCAQLVPRAAAPRFGLACFQLLVQWLWHGLGEWVFSLGGVQRAALIEIQTTSFTRRESVQPPVLVRLPARLRNGSPLSSRGARPPSSGEEPARRSPRRSRGRPRTGW